MIVRKTLSVKKILKFTWRKLLYIISVGTLASVLYENFDFNAVAIPIAPVAILGTALAILLGFRNNSAYDRWWEARRLWGAVVNDSRSLGRQITTFFRPVDPPQRTSDSVEMQEMATKIVRRQIAFAYALCFHLRKQAPFEKLKELLGEQDLERTKQSSNVPNELLQQQAEDLREAQQSGYIDDYRHMQIDTRLSALCDSMGGCERIKNTVFPRQYSVYTTVFTWLFITLLPFCLVADLGYLTIPFTVIIGFIFMVLETVGKYIENPFENTINDTPMLAICRTIEINLLQLIKAKEIPEPAQPVDGFLF